MNWFPFVSLGFVSIYLLDYYVYCGVSTLQLIIVESNATTVCLTLIIESMAEISLSLLLIREAWSF